MRAVLDQSNRSPSCVRRTVGTILKRAHDRADLHLIIRLAIAVLIVASPTASPADSAKSDPVIALPDGTVFPVPRMEPSNADPMNPASPSDVLTQRNNNLRTGATILPGFNQDFVKTGFGLIGILGSDDMEKTPSQDGNAIVGVVSAQPLFMERVHIKGAVRSVVFIATSANWIYAFDADTLNKLWEKHLGEPFTVSEPFREGNPDAVKACNMAGTQNHDFGPNSFVELGIESTPVIALSGTPRIIVTYRKMDTTPGIPGTFGKDGMTTSGAQWIAALALEDGGILQDRRITDDAMFNQIHRTRASLLLDGDRIDIAFAGRCEDPDTTHFFFKRSYQGWIYALNANDLSFAGRYRTTQQPDGSPPLIPSDDLIAGGGIWQATTGLAADGHDNLYFATGNQSRCHAKGDENWSTCLPPDAAGKNLSNSIVRLHIGPLPGGAPNEISMTPTDWFTPYRKTWLDHNDLDFASAGVVLIPNTKYLVAGGKDGMMYVLDRNHLGKFDNSTPFDASTLMVPQPDKNSHTSGDDVGRDALNRDFVVQKFQAAQNQYCAAFRIALYCLSAGANYPPPPPPPGPGVTTSDWIAWPHIHGTPVFGAFPDGRAFLYLWAEKDFLKSFQWFGRRFDTSAATIDPNNLSEPGKIGTNQSGKPVLAPPYLPGDRTPPGSGSVGMPGGMLSLSIDPSQPAGGVLFASVQRCRPSSKQQIDLEKIDPVLHECDVNDCSSSNQDFSQCGQQRFGILRAFDPITLHEIWNNQTDQFATDPKFGKFNPPPKTYWYVKFVPPTIAHNRVFLPTASRRVLVYGRR